MKCRIDKYLNNYKFFTNSIDFRILSAKEIERWKNVQSFQLNQLVNGKVKFSDKIRELLLLRYDLWSKALYECENYFIEQHGYREHKIVDERDLEFFYKIKIKTIDMFDEVVAANPNNFDTKFTEIYAKQNKIVQRHTNTKMLNLLNMSFKSCFSELVSMLINGMQHSLVNVYELHNLFLCEKTNTDDEFIVFTDYDNELANISNECSLSSRLKIYAEYFEFRELYIKNNTNVPMNAKLADEIENVGFSINYKLSSRFEQP